MKKSSDPKASGVLGLYVTPDTLEAVLVRKRGERAEVVQRFLRQRVREGALASAGEFATSLPGLKGSDDSDYTLEVGDGSSSAFLPGELEALTAKLPGSGAPGDAAVSQSKARLFTTQLREILQECQGLGFDHPALAFSIGAPEVSPYVIQLPDAAPDKGGAKGAKKQEASAAKLDRKRLTAALADQHGVTAASRVAFLPMAGGARALALAVDPAEPVAPTLADLRTKHEALAPASAHLDAESAVYAAVVGGGLRPGTLERTVLVRVGAADTLVMFFEGEEVLHLERLRSLSSYDNPEMVCSRVLLQQDEKRVGEIATVVVASAGRVEPLVQAFRSFFPDAAVEPLHEVLAQHAAVQPEQAEALGKAPTAAATAAALCQLEGWSAAAETDLLPKELKRSRRGFSVAWHTVLAAVLLLGAVGVSYVRYQAKAAEVEVVRQELRRNPPPVALHNPAVLQARVDSLNLAYTNYTRALTVLDSLLVGSDQWISTMERVSRATTSTPRTWIDGMDPQSATSLRLTGHSLERLSIVEMARKLNGAIEQLTYQDVGQQRVYFFNMVIPTPLEIPRAAQYLRNVGEDADPEPPVEVHPARHTH